MARSLLGLLLLCASLAHGRPTAQHQPYMVKRSADNTFDIRYFDFQDILPHEYRHYLLKRQDPVATATDGTAVFSEVATLTVENPPAPEPTRDASAPVARDIDLSPPDSNAEAEAMVAESRGFGLTSGCTSISVSIIVHVGYDGETRSRGFLSLTTLQGFLDELNTAFAASNFHFVFRQIDYFKMGGTYDNILPTGPAGAGYGTGADFISFHEFLMRLGKGLFHPNSDGQRNTPAPFDAYTLHIWSVKSAPIVAGAIAYATFPYLRTSTGTLSSITNTDAESTLALVNDGIMMGEAYWGDNAGGRYGDIIHEVGHWMGLMHTFQGGCANTGGGDGVDDTPASEVAYTDTTCQLSSLLPTCPNQPASELSLLLNNYMSYYPGQCLNQFTPGQIQRMNDFAGTFRFNGYPCGA